MQSSRERFSQAIQYDVRLRRSLGGLFNREINRAQLQKTQRLVRRTSSCTGDADASKRRITLRNYANVNQYDRCDVQLFVTHEWV
jgi:hypothetical protein